MPVLDTLALWGRRYEQQHVPRNGSTTFTLNDVLQMFDKHVILELTALKDGKPAQSVKPDPVRKLKVSLLDSISHLEPDADVTYEVLRTAPDGDVSKVRIVAHRQKGGPAGEIRMTIGPRTFTHYFEEDPILDHVNRAR